MASRVLTTSAPRRAGTSRCTARGALATSRRWSLRSSLPRVRLGSSAERPRACTSALCTLLPQLSARTLRPTFTHPPPLCSGPPRPGMPACSTPVLKSLAGKAGKARRALQDLGLDSAAGDDLSMLRGLGEDGEGEDALPGLEDDSDDGEWEVNDEAIAKEQRVKQVSSGGEAALLLGAEDGGLGPLRACLHPHHCGLARPAFQGALAEKSIDELKAMQAKEGFGALFPHFGTVAQGLRACDAVDSLVNASAIDTLLSNFIVPLQSGARACLQARVALGVAASAGGGVQLNAPRLSHPRLATAAQTTSARTTAPGAASIACTARSTSTPRRGASPRGGPTCRTSLRWRRTATRCVCVRARPNQCMQAPVCPSASPHPSRSPPHRTVPPGAQGVCGRRGRGQDADCGRLRPAGAAHPGAHGHLQVHDRGVQAGRRLSLAHRAGDVRPHQGGHREG